MPSICGYFPGKCWRLPVLAACCWIVFSGSALAQISTATISGRVRDSSDAVVPGASVVLIAVETGVQRHAVSNSAGNYSFFSVPPGRYTMATSAKGFNASKASEFILAVNQTLSLETILEVGTLEQAIEITVTGDAVQGATAELGSVVAEQEVQSLPLNGRNFTQLLVLSPGASPINVSQNAGAGTFGTPTTAGGSGI